MIDRLIKVEERAILTALQDRRLSVEELWRSFEDTVDDTKSEDERFVEFRTRVKIRLARPEPYPAPETSRSARENRPPAFVAGDVMSATSTEPLDGFWAPIQQLRQTALTAYAQPMWRALVATEEWAPSQKGRGEKTLDRYRVSIEALEDVIRMCRVDFADLAVLASVGNEPLVAALTHLRRRGVPFEKALLWAGATDEERSSMNIQSSRVGDITLDSLKNCPSELAQVLRGLGNRVPRLSTALAVFEARSAAMEADVPNDIRERSKSDRKQRARAVMLNRFLNELGQYLNEEATISSLLQLHSGHWKALHRIWGATDTDWMQMRRALMAGLTSLTGSKHDPLRCRVIERVPSFKLVPHSLPITLDQYRRMLAHLSDFHRAIVIAITAAGLRIDEYERLMPHHLNDNTCTIHVPGSKTDSSRATIAVDPVYWPYVRRAVPAQFKRSAIRQMLIHACEEAGIDPIRVHDLRHCLGHFAAAGGATREQLQAMLRHKSPQMTAIYTEHAKVEKTAEAFARAVGSVEIVDLRQHIDSARVPTSAFGEPSRRAKLDGLSREQLYALVWEHPGETVAHRLGVSFAVVRARCTELNIPLPKYGHWRRKRLGQAKAPTPLPPLRSDEIE